LVRTSAEATSAAEFVDLVRACVELGMGTDHEDFKLMLRLVTSKSRRASSGR